MSSDVEFQPEKLALLVEEAINNLAYMRMKGELEKYKGKYIVIAKGMFLGAFDTLEDVGSALKELDEVPKHAIVVKVGADEPIRELEWLGGSMELQSE